jgi:hypothetical protein
MYYTLIMNPYYAYGQPATQQVPVTMYRPSVTNHGPLSTERDS